MVAAAMSFSRRRRGSCSTALSPFPSPHGYESLKAIAACAVLGFQKDQHNLLLGIVLPHHAFGIIVSPSLNHGLGSVNKWVSTACYWLPSRVCDDSAPTLLFKTRLSCWHKHVQVFSNPFQVPHTLSPRPGWYLRCHALLLTHNLSHFNKAYM